MKNAFLLLLLLCSSYLCKGQYIHIDSPQYVRIKKDTIHIRGVVVDVYNNPAKDIVVVSKNKEIEFYGWPLYTRTDSAGNFELDGALVTDTLEIWWRRKINVINKGSRYVQIRLPGALADTIKVPGSVTAKRVVKKNASPVFKVVTNANIADYFGVYLPEPMALYPGGLRRFHSDVNQSIIYPQKAIQNNIEGEVEIGFSIRVDGTVGDFHVIKGIGYGCEQAVIAVIKMTSNWSPRVLYGKPVTSNSSVTINFKLTDN